MSDGAIASQDLEPLFDLAKDPIPSFGALVQERAKVFSKIEAKENFRRLVESMGTDGEEGRRRGFGLWMLADYNAAADQLAKYEDDDVAAFTLANSLLSANRAADAKPIYERLSNKFPDEPKPRGGWLESALEAGVASGDADAILAALESLGSSLASAPDAFKQSAEFSYLSGRCAEIGNDPQSAIDHYSAARDKDPTHRRNLFRLAYVAERTGLDDLAVEAYESLLVMHPVDATVLMNAGVLYEDLGRDQDAAACYDIVVRNHPEDRRARLFLEDAIAGMEMFYDEDLEKKEDRLNQILRIPITDFELSVRARNCLNKMDIMTLGDLVKKTEAELLSYKNFGETSLAEIKEILGSKGLRLGMAREEAVASIAKSRVIETMNLDQNDPRNKPVGELKLSIRARRTVENLGCLTLGDIGNHAEDELLGMPNFGVTSLLELKGKLEEYGLKLKGDDK